MWSKEIQTKYFALSGSKYVELKYGEKLQQLAPQYLHYEQIFINDEVRYYYDIKHFFRYGDVQNKRKKEIEHMVSCCERKLLSAITDLDSDYNLFIRFAPCEKCRRAFENYDPENKINVIMPKHVESQKKIQENKISDELARNIVKLIDATKIK